MNRFAPYIQPLVNGLAVMLVISIIFAVSGFFLPVAYAVSVQVAAWVCAAFDELFGAVLYVRAPWLMWAVGGAVLGCAAGLWTVAPIYGWRRYRPAILIAPVVLLALFSGAGHMVLAAREEARVRAAAPVWISNEPRAASLAQSLSGPWFGTYDGVGAALSFPPPEGGLSTAGTMSVGYVTVNVTGTAWWTKLGQVSVTQTSFSPPDRPWSYAQGTGMLSPDGTTFTGASTDQTGVVHRWTFKRQ